MAALILALLFQDSTPDEKVRVSGDLWTAYALTDGVLVDAQAGLNAGAASSGANAIDRFTGRARVRFDIQASERVSGVVEIESRSRDLGVRLGFARDDADEPKMDIEQAYVRAKDFLMDGADLLFGVQDLRYALRPHGEAVLLDVTESESAFAGRNTANTAMRNVTFPDTLEPAGLVWRVDPRGGWRVDVFAMKVLDNASGVSAGGAPPRDESVYGVYFDAIPDPERVKVFAVMALFHGGVPGADVGTFGLGADFYFGGEKELEVFAEVYLQRGDFAKGIDKSAEAVLGGARWVMFLERGTLAFEASGFLASGDRDAADSTEESFQSFESMSRLAILQSDEWGLDIDTNYRVFTLTAQLKVDDVELTLAAGMARFDHAPRDAAGARYMVEKELGFEVDLDVRWRFDPSLEFFARVASLSDCDVMFLLTGDGEAMLFLAGARLSW